MTNINILNLEKIIFSNQKVQEYFRCELPELYIRWQEILCKNNRSEKLKFYIEFIKKLQNKNLLNYIEKLLDCKIIIENIDVDLIKQYDVDMQNIENFDFKEVQDYKFFAIYRNDKKFKFTAWR